jgi:hydrogenase maturation protease
LKPDGLDALRAAEGPVRLVGLGNTGLGDDVLGVRLAEAMAGRGYPHVVVAGTTPEADLEWLAAGGCARVVFLDAVEFDGEPGAVAWMEAEDLAARYPQVSTHKLSLGLLARLLEARGVRVSLLGVKPQSLAPGAGLSEPVRRTLGLLADLLDDVLGHPNVVN